MDETELSFIRCTNCRSLVPAVASRCRMCGFVLKEVSARPEEVQNTANGGYVPVRGAGPDGERPSRVRQRTISVSGNSAEAIEAAIYTEPVLAAAPVEPLPPPAPPIVERALREPSSITPPSMALGSRSSTPASVAPVSAPVRPPAIAEEDTDAFDDEEFTDDNFEEEDFFPDNPREESIPTAAPPEGVKKKRRRRRKKKRPESPLTPPAHQPDSPAPVQVVERQSVQEEAEEPEFEDLELKEPEFEEQEFEEPEFEDLAEEGHSDGPSEVIAPWRSKPGASQPGFKIAESPPPAEETVRKRADRGVSLAAHSESVGSGPKESVAGALVGWFVSYEEDLKGVARELRAGKFFVGREQLRPSDFVVDHSSVSTPQCLVVCDSVSGVALQDLMSEGGTRVIRGNQEFNAEQVRLEHGDRVRFGQYEMLFVKLP